MTRRTILIMTPAELTKGRFMRAPDGDHDSGVSAPAPAPSAEPDQTPLASDKEYVETGPKEITAEDLEAEFGGDSDPATPQAEDGEPEGEEPERKPGASAEERIAEITAARREAERQAAEARRDADEWRRKAEALNPPKVEQPTEPDKAPDPEQYDFGEADARFIADTATYHARAEFQRQQSAADLKLQFADMEAKWKTSVATPEIVERYPDFDTVVTKAADAGEWDCSPLMAIGIKQSPVGADVAYFLATNRADASRISRMTNIEQALEFGRLEGRFMRDPQPEAKVTVKPTQAPAPPSSRARGSGGQFAVPADTEDFSAFEKMADGILASRRR